VNKWKASVRRVTGKTIHSRGELVDGRVVPVERMPEAAWVMIEETSSGFYLFRYSATGEFGGDTWHETLEEAKRQAEFEYGIEDPDWELEETG
jgi:hypothetical protein